jgi:nickel-type superoxide dismutase maturation protease
MPALPFKFPRIAFPRVRTIAVSGNSMSPTYNDGDWLLFRELKVGNSSPLDYLVGKVVVIERESYPGVHFIKRIVRLENEGYWVEGDNRDSSTDSRTWGTLGAAEIVGVILLRYHRAK